jgi:lipid-binding SYLF domain-containing protein
MRLQTTALFIVLMTFSVTTFADREVENYSETIEIFNRNDTVTPYFGSAYGYAVFPTIGKAGLGIGGSHGKGQVYRGDNVTGFTSATSLSIGFQAGGQAFRQIIFFEDESAYKNFTSGNFEFDAQASAVAITASAQASAGTTGAGASAGAGGSAGKQAETPYRKGMLVFTIAKGGLMYEASIGGQKFSYDPLKQDDPVKQD